MPAFLETRDLDYRVDGVQVLNGLNVAFAEGEVTALLGHNGSGKSTLLKLLARQLTPARGQCLLQGENIQHMATRPFARAVGYLPQQPPSTDGLTVAELVALGRYPWRGALGRYQSDDYSAIDEALAETELEGMRHRQVDSLSGGERQRAWLAMLLAQQTQVLLLDEPISALDVRHQVETLALIQRLARERQLTVIMVMHDVDLSARFCDRMIALRRQPEGGRIVADGRPEELMNAETLETIYDIPMGVLKRPDEYWISYAQ